MNKKTSDPQYSHSETDGIKLLVKVQMDHNYQLNIYLFIYLFIQIAYYTHMGQAITIQKHANIYKKKQKKPTNIIYMYM